MDAVIVGLLVVIGCLVGASVVLAALTPRLVRRTYVWPSKQRVDQQEGRS